MNDGSILIYIFLAALALLWSFALLPGAILSVIRRLRAHPICA